MSLPITSPSTPAGGAEGRTFFGHPAGLYVLFFTEMWERFSYYGMRALLMLYMLNYFKWTQADASMVYKWYTSLVYLTPILGGYLADRYLGNRKAVIIGAILMAIGHFLMAFEEFPIFFSALLFLILGNGFFKPNMSTQVGRLYPQNDARRDGAYTIFYMGINLGAFLSPLVCGWLAANTLGRYHSGFTAAGIGMVMGLLVYVLGQRWVREIDPSVVRQGGGGTHPSPGAAPEARAPRAITEAAAEHTPSALPRINGLAPRLLVGAGCALAGAGPLLALTGFIALNTAIATVIASICFLIGGWILSKTHNAARDRVMAIYALGIFVVFFWGGFEQAGNVLNVWADKVTDRFLTKESKPPALHPPVKEDKPGQVETERGDGLWDRFSTMFQPMDSQESEEGDESMSLWDSLWNPVSTEWFQSINALAIFILAPFFAVLWVALDRRGLNPSIPTKMALGVLLMSVAFAFMVMAAQRENQPTQVALDKNFRLPDAIKLNDMNQLSSAKKEGGFEPYHAGRLQYDKASHTLQMTGVLPDLERDRMVRATAPENFKKKVEELKKRADEAKGKKFKVSVKLDKEPPGFTLDKKPPGAGMIYAGFKKSEVNYDPATRTLTTTKRLPDKDVKSLLVAGGDPQFRDTLSKLMVESSNHRVSPYWLFWFYIIATVGELCLSPVGLSMVSKLAPARFATMLMGLWMLTSFFGNFLAGALGEIWGKVAPTPFFMIFVIGLGLAALVLFLSVRKIVAVMHGVN